jgi:hypothetical protein
MALDKEEFSHPFGRTMNSSPAREKIETHPSKQLRHVLQYLMVMMRQVVALFQLSLCLSRACLGKLIFFVLNHGAKTVPIKKGHSICVLKVPFEAMHDHLRDHFEHIQRAKAQLHYFPPRDLPVRDRLIRILFRFFTEKLLAFRFMRNVRRLLCVSHCVSHCVSQCVVA